MVRRCFASPSMHMMRSLLVLLLLSHGTCEASQGQADALEQTLVSMLKGRELVDLEASQGLRKEILRIVLQDEELARSLDLSLSNATRRDHFQLGETFIARALSTESDPQALREMKMRLLRVMRASGPKLEAQEAAGEADKFEEEIFSAGYMQSVKEEIIEMFQHSFDNYMRWAYPYDELKPISCSGKDLFGQGGYKLTLIDALDTLAIMGNISAFDAAVRKVMAEVSFDVDINVSVFETNIRALGGLLSAHFLAIRFLSWYKGELLLLAVDLADRLMPAFRTKTGIPYGTVNLRRGVPPGETVITSAAGGGTNLLELVLLSRLTLDPKYELAARKATTALWSRRSRLGLVGNHINIESGVWTHHDSGLGTNIDSFYEYLIKAHFLFGDGDALGMFSDCYAGIMKFLRKGAWYLDVNMQSGAVSWMVYSSLASFWPGLQVLFGDMDAAVESQYAIHSLWRRFGGIPEAFNLEAGKLHTGAEGYPLRPETVESIYYLYQATHDPVWLSMGLDVLASLKSLMKTPCGYAAMSNVETKRLEDRMDSYFLAETLKYLFLLFDDSHWLNHEPHVFNTEGHPLPVKVEYLVGHNLSYEELVKTCQLENGTSCYSGGRKMGVCRKTNFKRKLSAYGFDLLEDELEDNRGRTEEPRDRDEHATRAEGQKDSAAAQEGRDARGAAGKRQEREEANDGAQGPEAKEAVAVGGVKGEEAEAKEVVGGNVRAEASSPSPSLPPPLPSPPLTSSLSSPSPDGSCSEQKTPPPQEPVKAVGVEESPGLQEEAGEDEDLCRRLAEEKRFVPHSTQFKGGQPFVLRMGRCGYGFYVEDGQGQAEGGEERREGGRVSREERAKEVLQRLQEARNFRLDHNQLGRPSWRHGMHQDPQVSARILDERVRREMEHARRTCQQTHQQDKEAAEECEMKLWNKLLRQAGAQEIVID